MSQSSEDLDGKMKTLSNDFHNTQISVSDKTYHIALFAIGGQRDTPTYGDFVYAAQCGMISMSTVYRIKNKLCGSNNCSCGIIR